MPGPTDTARGQLFPALAIAFAALMFAPLAVSAAAPIQLTLTPIGADSHFTLTMQPGETRNLTVQAANHGAESVLAHTFAADAYSMVNGGLAVRLADEPTSGATTWLNYRAADLDLAPGATIDRPFTVTVPATTMPGEYLTGVVLQNAESTSSAPSGQSAVVLKQIVREVVAVSINVPGPRTPALELGALTQSTVGDRFTIDVAVNNTGNVRLAPSGELRLWDSAGQEVSRFPITMGTLYAHTDTSVEVPFAKRLNPGNYTAQLDLTDASGVTATSGKRSLSVAELNVKSTPGPAGAVPALARTNQTAPPEAVVALDPLRIALFGFGGGVVLMVAAAGVGTLIYRRRRNSRRPA